MCSRVILLAMSLLAISSLMPVFAEEPLLAKPVQTYAKTIAEAVDEGDDAKLDALVAKNTHDPWLVVEALLAKDDNKAAHQLAVRLPASPDTRQLASYIKKCQGAARVTIDRVSSLLRDLRNLEQDEAKNDLDFDATARLAIAERAQALGWLSFASRILDLSHATSKQDAAFTLKCLQLWIAVEQHREQPDREVRVRGAIAKVLSQQQRPREALAYAEPALRLKLPSKLRHYALVMNVSLLVTLGENARVLALVPELRKQTTAQKNAIGTAIVDLQWAAANANLGRPAAALARLDHALRVIEAAGPIHLQQSAHMQAANIAIIHRDPERATKHVQRARAKGQLNKIVRLHLDRLEADALFMMGRIDDSMRVTRGSVQQIPKNDVRSQTPPRTRLMSLHLAKRDVDAAKIELDWLTNVLQSGALDAKLRREVVRNICYFYVFTGAYERALTIAERELARETDYDDPAHRRGLRYHASQAALQLGATDKALQHVDALIALTVDTTNEMPERTLKESRASWVGLATMAIDAAMAAKDAGRVVSYLELIRAVSTRARIGVEHVESRTLRKEDKETLDKLRDAERMTIAAFQKLNDDKSKLATTKRVELVKRLSSIRESLAERREAIRAQRVVAGHILYPSVDSLRDVQLRLAADEAFIYFAFGRVRAVALLVTAKATKLMNLGMRSDVASVLEGLAIGDSMSSSEEDLEILRTAIGKPLALPKHIVRVSISGEAAFTRVPYALLWPTREIVMVSSATIQRLLQTESSSGKDVLAVADPAAPNVSRLVGARATATSIATRVLADKDATEEAIDIALKRKERWRSVHFACHAAMDEAKPLQSALLVSPSKHNDGFMTVLELLDASVQSELVVLAACSTGTRNARDVDGTLTFVNAFFVSGATRVIVSLWDVNDEATAALFKKFYALWKPATSPGAALAKAQAWMRTQKKWKHPAHWAGWQIWGPR